MVIASGITYDVLEMTALHNNRSLSGSLSHNSISSHVDNVPVEIASEFNQPLFLFIDAVYVCLINTFMHDCPCLIVSCVEV